MTVGVMKDYILRILALCKMIIFSFFFFSKGKRETKESRALSSLKRRKNQTR